MKIVSMMSRQLGLLICTGLLPWTSAIDPYFWHLTDFHVEPSYWTTQDSCNDAIPEDNLGPYGDFECDAPYELIKTSVDALMQHGREPKFILYTGDTPPHPKNYTTSEFSNELIIDLLHNATDLLNKTFPDMKFVVALGNHDYFPKDQLPGENNPVYEAAAEMWKPWLGNSQEAIATFKRGAYYTMMIDETDKFRVVVTNTNLYLANNKVTEGQADPAGQYLWLRTVLAAARTNEEKVHLIAHVPPGVMEVTGGPRWLREEDNTKFNNIVRDYSDVIVAVYSCHQHFDTFRIYYKDGEPVVPMFIAPSVTPWRARFGVGYRGAAHNPGVRKIYYDKYNGHLTDIEQFYLDLSKANQDKTADWKRLYTFKGLYQGVDNMTAPTLHGLAQDFRKYASTNFHKYYDMNSVGSRQPSNVPCSCGCKFLHICSIENVDFDNYEACSQVDTCGATRYTLSMVGLLTIVSIFKLLFV